MASLAKRLFHFAVAFGGLLAVTATPAGAAPFCVDTTPPNVDPAFSPLQGAVDVAVGKPRECAHFVLSGEMLIQHLDTGALLLNASTGDATFTDGSNFWTLTPDGGLSQSPTPPDLVLPALLMDVVPPDRTTATTSPDVAVAGAQISPTSTPVATSGVTEIPTPGISSTPNSTPMYFGDPRTVALQLSDLPNGAHSWLLLGQDTTRLLQFQYTTEFGRHPDNGNLLPLDPMMIVNVLMGDSIEHTQTVWDQAYGKPGPGQRAGSDLSPFTDQQFYAIAPNVIDVRARNRNVILQAVEVTSGRDSISLEDTVAAVRIMASRVDGLVR